MSAVSIFRLALLVACLKLASAQSSSGCGCNFVDYNTSAPYLHSYHLYRPPRWQWNANNGYCGENSFMTAGLNLGQWVGQYQARSIASPNVDQSVPGAQLLLGVNDVTAAKAMNFTYDSWSDQCPDSGKVTAACTTEKFVSWVKQHVMQNHTVVIGVLVNDCMICPEDDDQFDHIVPVSGWGSNHPLSDFSYYADDIIYFHDNGFYTPFSDDDPVYYISAEFQEFIQTRENANLPSSYIYSLLKAEVGDSNPNFGIAITGLLWESPTKLVSTLVETDKNYELPSVRDCTNLTQADNCSWPVAPLGEQLNLKVTASELTPFANYITFIYSDWSSLPQSAQPFQATGTSQVVFDKYPTFSNKTVIFRTIWNAASARAPAAWLLIALLFVSALSRL